MHRFILLSALIAFAIGPAYAQDDIPIAKARAKASLDLMQLQRQRADIANAKAKAAESLLKICAEREHADCMCDLDAATARARKENAPMFVWVGMTCDREVRAAFPTAVHVHLESMNGSAVPRVVIQRPDLTTLRLFKGELGTKAIQPVREWLAPVKTSSLATPVSRFVSLPANC